MKLNYWMLLMVLLSPLVGRAELAIPGTPLGVSQAAKPMTLIVAGKDHKLFYEAYNDASDIDGDGILDTRFNPQIVYFGLFDPTVCYLYFGSSPDTGGFVPNASATEDGKCISGWSGNWLNYVTTSRIDAMRKVLYGGFREVDTDTTTILRRAYIPQDAHSWAKEYTSEAVDGYDISDYTPFVQPAPGLRHFFGNTTANAYASCVSLDNCSDRPPLLSVVLNSNKRVWEWASKERPVLDSSHGGSRHDFAVRVEVCTSAFHNGCKQYPNGNFKPVGLLHDYGENEAMLFGLLTGSYEKNMSGGVLRKVVSSFKDEVDPDTGVFTSSAKIVETFDRLRIRGFNNGTTGAAYTDATTGVSWPDAWVTTHPMQERQFPDWGNPIAEMMYEGLRYFAGKSYPTSTYATSGGLDDEVGLTVDSWDNPYDQSSSAAKAEWCAAPNMLVMSDINPSYDSDQLPGSVFGSFSGDLPGLDVGSISDLITSHEPDVTGLHFIGQSGSDADGIPTAKSVLSLKSIRGLAPEEPTKGGSYYSAAVAYYGKVEDVNATAQNSQTVDSFFVALASPLPRIEFPTNEGTVTIVPFAKSVGGCLGINPNADFQPTNQIVDFYVDTLANLPGAPTDASINGGRPYARFRINFEDVEQGADHDMDAITEYEVALTSDGKVEITLSSTYAAGCIQQHIGYVISGTTNDGAYLVVRDADTSAGSDTNYVLDEPNVPGALPQTATHVYTPGGSSATLLKDPLWYAAKWGGFIDENDNDIPDLESEWDADGNGVPDTYFLVQNPLKLKETLKRTLDSIIERSASAGNVTSNSTSITSDTLVFQSLFNTAKWSGDLLALPVTTSGVGSTPVWKASDQVPGYLSRKVYTTSGGSAVEFLFSSLSTSDQTYLGGEDEVNFLRGDRSKEVQNGGIFRERAAGSVIGDIVHSSPYYVKEDDVVYVGANDGMLHAFSASSGVELFAYIPSAVIPRLRNLTLQNYGTPNNPHQYFVDGDIAVSDENTTPGKNYLVATLGHGGKGLFALDVSNPGSFSAANVLWEYFDSSDADLGLMLGRPTIAKMNDGSVRVIVGNGYNSTSGKAVLYLINVETGAVTKLDTQVGGDNGMASPGVFDEDGDGIIDWIYAGDLKGNVWKVDVTGNSAAAWGFAFGTSASPEPLFTAHDPSGSPQPITAQISVAVDDVLVDANYGKRFVFFGTGSYFRSGDPSSSQVQSWYGLIDDGTQISTRSSGSYADLTERQIKDEGTLSGASVRTFEAASDGDMTGKSGWYLDFDTQSGERMVTSSKLYKLAEPTLIASSIIPVVDPCVPGGRGYINAINPFTGARLSLGFFDLNENDDFTDDVLNNTPIGGVDPGVGMPSEPVLVGDRLVVGGSKGEVASVKINPGLPANKGRFFWREIILEQ